jgi:azobenzene reductase
LILLVCGSPRPCGLTNQTLDLIENLLIKRRHCTRRIGVQTLKLPIFGPDSIGLQQVNEWRQSILQASALVIGSPEYHGSFSGGLKNLLDYLDIGMLEGKPTAIVAAAGSPRSGISTLNSMRNVLRNLHAPVIVEQLAVSRHDLSADHLAWSQDVQSYCVNMIDGLLSEVERRQSSTSKAKTHSKLQYEALN